MPIGSDERGADNNLLVLVVDDDHTHQRMMELLAERLGVTAYAVGCCAEALQALSMVAFDAILMDYRMPEVDGCDCARKIRVVKEVNPKIPIIAVTAHLEDGIQEKCTDAGMDDFLAKPFTFEELQEKLSRWLELRTES